MITELAIATIVVEMVRAVVWNHRDWKQHTEKGDLFIKTINESKTWEEVFRKVEEQRINRPDLYTPIPEPLIIKMIFFFDPESRVQKWKGYKHGMDPKVIG